MIQYSLSIENEYFTYSFDMDNSNVIKSKIVDEIIILELVKIAFKYNYKIKRDEIRDLLFNSKYTYINVEKKDLELNNYLSQLNNIIEKHQYNEYNCILLNNDNDYLKQRLYISPNPENMYELIKVVVNYFIKEKLTVKIKYQQSTNIKYTDRIIIFINENAQNKTVCAPGEDLSASERGDL